MTGPHYDEDGPDEFRPAPHPDDRLWRHPSEIAAMQAAAANAPTNEMPAIQVVEPRRPRSKPHLGLMVATGVVVVGAAALTLGVMSRGSVSESLASQNTLVTTTQAEDQDETASVSTNPRTSTGVDVSVNDTGEELLTDRIHSQVAISLPRVQAATSDGMREGSGLFVTDDGHIATSAALIDGADYVLAWTEDDQRWKVHVVASDPVSDVAIVQIDSDDWPAIPLGTGSDLWNGQYALALDHADDTIVLGEVTSVSDPMVGIDQPAALPGSAIIDASGVVIAMVISDGTDSHATPAWMLEQVTVDLLTVGETNHVWLGVVVESGTSDDNMVHVSEVIADSPAFYAGLRTGDLIDSINGTTTANAAALHREVQAAEPGDDAVLTVTRNNSRRIIIATIAELPR